VLRDNARDWTVPESSIVIEYLAQHYPGPVKLVPDDPDQARQVRMNDRFFDFYVMDQMSKIVTDNIRPPGKNDPHGVEQARAQLSTALDMVERTMATRQHPVGESFTMADCAAAPALFYADKVMPLSESCPHASSYLRRLTERPSFARVLKEAEPYLAMFPG
jgi:glutathione S-transferase